VWTYVEHGEDIMRVARFDLPDGSKQFRPVHRCGANSWKIGDPPGLLPLYHVDDLGDGVVVHVCEGEKATEAARSIGLAATTSAHGSAAADKSDWTPLAGREVVILPDHDDPGAKYARDVARQLHKLSPPARVKIVDLPGLPDGGDIVEFIANGGTREDIERRVSGAPPIDAHALAAEPWPDPLPLPEGLPPVMPFDFDVLPESLRDWIRDICERMQCPPDYCAATAIVAAGSMIGRKIAIRPKRHDDWQVVPNLYGVNVGRPSVMKSPAMKEVLKFTAQLEIEAKQEHAKQLAEHEATALLAAATKKVRMEVLKKTVKSGGDAQTIANELVAETTKAPTRRRYIVNDTTVEKLGVILNENPNGVLLFADEFVGLLRCMEREGHEADRGFYLTAWAGDSRYTYDRIGRGTLDIEAAIVSLTGSIQPGVLADYLRGAVSGGRGDDGFIQRLQMSVWPDPPTTWENIDRYPDSDAKAKAYAALKRLAELTPASVSAERDDYERDALPFLRFDRDAQDAFDAWRADLETRLRRGDEHPAVESHLAKYRSLIPALALMLHLLDGSIGPVTLVAVKRAIGWGHYLESHARRLYAGVTEAPAIAARLLATRIQRGDVTDLFAARDVYRYEWSGLDRERTQSAIDVLVSLHWLEERVEPTTGRNRTRYAINPKVAITPKEELTKPTEAPFVSSVSAVPEELA
jgi:putative DNA primase/helicase